MQLSFLFSLPAESHSTISATLISLSLDRFVHLSNIPLYQHVMEWTTTINLGGFGDSSEMEWQTVRSWDSFTNFFDGAVHVDAVTYCESPDLLLELFEREDSQLQSMDVLVGNREEYQSSVDDVNVAQRLARLYREDKLTIRLKNRKVVHSKLYRVVKPDDEVTLIAGSANLSYNSWSNQTNSVVVFQTDVGSNLDEQFQNWIVDHHQYSDEVFIADLAEQLEEIDDEEEKERRIELWVDNRDTQLSERGEVHSDAGDMLEELGQEVDKVYSVEDDPDDPDGIVMVDDDAGEDIAENGDDDSPPEDGIKAAKTSNYTITLPTQSLEDDGYVDEIGNDLQQRGADVGSNAITTPVDGYSNYVQTKYDVPKMWLDEERNNVHLQHSEDHRILTADKPATPKILDQCLENIEDYVETVDRWGETNNEEAVMAHMYEGVLYAMWSPFVNLYAESFYGDVTLDNALQYLYIYGESDAGKDKFGEFILRLISDDLVRGGADADEVGKNQIRALRSVDTVFPYVVSDIAKQKIERIDTLRNFWKDSWHPTQEVSYPTLIFTSNDSRPNDWFRNRAKMLHFDVAFPSNPEDEDFYTAQQDLNEILEQQNPIFSYVSRRILTDEMYVNADDTVGHVREIFLDFYDRAEREIPDYFPKEPANIKHNIGKRKWKKAQERDDVTFERRDDQLIAEFELEPHELYSYRKTLPTKMRPEKSGRNIIIKNPDDFYEWLEMDGHADSEDDAGLLSRLLG